MGRDLVRRCSNHDGDSKTGRDPVLFRRCSKFLALHFRGQGGRIAFARDVLYYLSLYRFITRPFSNPSYVFHSPHQCVSTAQFSHRSPPGPAPPSSAHVVMTTETLHVVVEKHYPIVISSAASTRVRAPTTHRAAEVVTIT